MPIEALDADEVAILESRSDIALMCTDIQMPGSMDGLGLAHEVRPRSPAFIVHLLDTKRERQRKSLKSLALPSGRTERLRKTLKNQRKSASLLRGCYHVLLPPATPSNVLRLDRQPDGETANEILERPNAPTKRHAFERWNVPRLTSAISSSPRKKR